MSLKSKGINAERQLVHMFWAKNWACLRIAGSGSSRYPSPDILVSNKLRRLAIECKITKEQKKYFEKKGIISLKKFADVFGAEPWIAVKFKSHDWFFVSLDDLTETDKCFVIDAKKAKTKGLLFEEIIEIH
ncbi:Holliday junction resolvase [Candidatus Woesearchaeota archaeon]|nr:Holliday junction resolvase [Candidatus Woesearchaeota archaeon]|tara:strand:+ start:1010 stop:1402 length:393 start_codon:yes stop_codon:yes gene_type:complete